MFLYQTNGIRATYYTEGTGEIDVTDLNSKCVLNLNQNEITCSNAVTLKTAPQNVLPFAHFKLTNFGCYCCWMPRIYRSGTPFSVSIFETSLSFKRSTLSSTRGKEIYLSLDLLNLMPHYSLVCQEYRLYVVKFWTHQCPLKSARTIYHSHDDVANVEEDDIIDAIERHKLYDV